MILMIHHFATIGASNHSMHQFKCPLAIFAPNVSSRVESDLRLQREPALVFDQVL